MASYRAVATGNFSNVAIWNIWNGSAWVVASVIPGSADDVWANNFTVTMDQDVTVLTIRNLNTGAPGTGTVSGGGFQITTGDITLTCVNNITQTMVGAVDLLTVNTSSGTTTLNITSIWTASGQAGRVITIAGTSIVNIVGDFMCGTNSQIGCRTTGVSTVNLVGNIRVVNYTSTVTTWDLAAGTTFNLTGNITPSLVANSQASCSGIRTSGNGCVITINGNLDWSAFNNTSNTLTGIFLINLNSTTNTLITVNGNIVGGTITNSHHGIAGFGVGSILEHNGTLFGGSGGGAGNGNWGVSTILPTVFFKLSGPFISGNYGCPPFIAGRMTLLNNVSNYIEFASNSTNGALFPAAPPTRMTMYSPDTIADSPIPSNVRQGVTYALGSQTGTLIVPSPSNVRKDIPTDNTVGTADLSAADMWNYLANNIITSGSIGEVVKDIKTKTDLIPNNPASVDAVGAIVASYNT
jgi:hypothetical protein